MPEALTMIQVNKVTPVPSVLVITAMSLAYLTSSNIIQLMNYVGFATWLAIGVAVFCVIYLRYKHPEWERPIKVKQFRYIHAQRCQLIFIFSSGTFGFSHYLRAVNSSDNHLTYVV